MLRCVFMWIAVMSLAGLGVSNVVSSLAMSGITNGGWTFYTPYTPSPLAMNINIACGQADRVFFPTATISLAMYILLLERELRQTWGVRGFEVRSLRKSDDA
jgi:hypothetical protein